MIIYYYPTQVDVLAVWLSNGNPNPNSGLVMVWIMFSDILFLFCKYNSFTSFRLVLQENVICEREWRKFCNKEKLFKSLVLWLWSLNISPPSWTTWRQHIIVCAIFICIILSSLSILIITQIFNLRVCKYRYI